MAQFHWTHRDDDNLETRSDNPEIKMKLGYLEGLISQARLIDTLLNWHKGQVGKGTDCDDAQCCKQNADDFKGQLGNLGVLQYRLASPDFDPSYG